ncbi:MAG TPA: lipase maturation factor family protein [Verrucomicrobiae bacterium]|nr:lipase maturation factor family protein [Verrucomicrobiae bacterium]
MNAVGRVALAPAKPVLIYDGDCNFCRLWIRRWQQRTGDTVEYVSLQADSVAVQFPELSRETLQEAVHLVGTDGSVQRAAAAVFGALAAVNPWPLWIYRSLPGARPVTETAYRMVARHRSIFSLLTRLFWGSNLEPASYALVRWLFLRGLGLVYLVAFLSLGSQVLGLAGSRGILPAEQTMGLAAQHWSAGGLSRFLAEPTLCWFRADDVFLKGQCTVGVILSGLVIAGIFQAPCLLLLWLLYLSLTVVGGVFLGYQWDNLLLETGLLAIFFAPVRWSAGLRRELAPSRCILWLLRWLLFRLLFASGCVKLLSGDRTWHELTALTFHYETQPLPTWVGWYVHQLPAWFQKGSCAAMFGVELVLPLFIWFPRRLRLLAFWPLVLLQLAIMLTGNYTFFNYLTLVLCLTLLDDQALRRLFPNFVLQRLGEGAAWERVHPRRWQHLARRLAVFPLTAVILILTGEQMLGMFRVRIDWPQPVQRLDEWASPFRSVNSYGLFAVMTTSRPEIVVEGSRDGVTWLPYEFPFKPGALDVAPRFVAPHQPRLDWQMWFAALGDVRQNPWFINFAVRLMQGAPEVLALVRHNPFPGRPPKYIRASLYEYRFTDSAGRQANGTWWRRDAKGLYCPPISLNGRQGL